MQGQAAGINTASEFSAGRNVDIHLSQVVAHRQNAGLLEALAQRGRGEGVVPVCVTERAAGKDMEAGQEDGIPGPLKQQNLHPARPIAHQDQCGRRPDLSHQRASS